MQHRPALEQLFQEHDCRDYRWIDPSSIIVSQWVRMKCRFGCPDYCKCAACPPNTPPVADCERFFSEYRTAVIFRFAKSVAKPEDRHAWSRGINRGLLKLERDVFLKGYQRAFVLYMDPCNLCSECAPTRKDCRNPQDSRPSPEALAVDVFATVRRCGLPIAVLSDYAEEMNRYSILMIE